MRHDEPIPVAVIGAGNMGINHVRVYDELPQAELIGVVEPNDHRAEDVAATYDTEVTNSIDDLGHVEAVSVAVPNDAHREVSIDCIKRGMDVLVEKPLAPTIDDATAIAETATEHEAILQVGHIERFNPAVQVLGEVLTDEVVIALEAHRLGPFNEHLSKESVVFDLMIHDIDVIRSLVDSPIKHVDAIGTQSKSNEIDHAIAHLKFDSGILGTCTSSHVTHTKIRKLTATTQSMFLELDYQAQGITISRRGTEQTTVLEGTAGYRTESIQETPFIQTREPLKNELEAFLESVRTQSPPVVGPDDGIAAVRLATEIVDLIRDN